MPGAGSSSRSAWAAARWASRRGLPMCTTHYADPAVHPIKRNGSAHVPAGTSRRVQRLNTIGSLPQATTAPAARSNTSPDFSIACIITASLRATATAARLKPIRSLSFRPPRPQRTLGRCAGQNHCGCFVEETAEVTIATSRNVAIIVDLSRLIPPGRQAEPSAN